MAKTASASAAKKSAAAAEPAAAAKPVPKIIEQHDYMSLVLGRCRLTVGRSGERASGPVPEHVWRAWVKTMKDLRSPSDATRKHKTIGEAVRGFAEDIDVLWPQWSDKPREFAVGESVTLDFGRRAGNPFSGVLTGKIVKRRGANYTINFGGEPARLLSTTIDLISERLVEDAASTATSGKGA